MISLFGRGFESHQLHRLTTRGWVMRPVLFLMPVTVEAQRTALVKCKANGGSSFPK